MYKSLSHFYLLLKSKLILNYRLLFINISSGFSFCWKLKAISFFIEKILFLTHKAKIKENQIDKSFLKTQITKDSCFKVLLSLLHNIPASSDLIDPIACKSGAVVQEYNLFGRVNAAAKRTHCRLDLSVELEVTQTRI